MSQSKTVSNEKEARKFKPTSLTIEIKEIKRTGKNATRGEKIEQNTKGSRAKKRQKKPKQKAEDDQKTNNMCTYVIEKMVRFP